MFIINEKKTKSGKTWSEVHQVFVAPYVSHNYFITSTGYAVFKAELKDNQTKYKLAASGLKTKQEAIKSAMWVGR